MLEAFSRERLRPSLFDRLDDGLAAAESRLERRRGALEQALDAPRREALAKLLEDKRLEHRWPLPEAASDFAGLDGEARALLDRVREAECERREAVRRTVVLSAEGLREAVKRDLASLLNTTAADARPDGAEGLFPRHPAVEASVLNYGIPALAGRVRGPDDLVEFARAVERAIERYEPRLRRVRVRTAGAAADAGPAAALTSPLGLVIEGELWGDPLPEQLLIRAVLDLDAGRVEVALPDGPA